MILLRNFAKRIEVKIVCDVEEHCAPQFSTMYFSTLHHFCKELEMFGSIRVIPAFV